MATSSVNRMNGIVSGWDTETLVKNQMKYDQAKLDKVKAAREIALWKKEEYKSYTSMIRGIQSEFMDVLKPTTNLKSKNVFNVYKASVTAGGAASTAVTATTTASSAKGTIVINSIDRLATKDTWESTEEIAKLEGAEALDLTALNTAIASGSGKLNFSYDGVTKSIALASSYADEAALVSDLQSKLNTTFGAGNITVSESSGVLSFTSVGHALYYAASDESISSALKLEDGTGNVLNVSKTVGDVFGVSDTDIDFTINGISSATMGIKSTDTIRQMMDKINASAAGVTMSYSTVSDKFTLKANGEGVVNSITMTGSFLEDKLQLKAGGHQAAVDAVLSINGVATTRSSNTFQVDGTTLQLNSTYTTAGSSINVDISSDPSNVIETIENFVVKYNELIAKITAATTEKKNRSYTPLTDEQKDAMTETQITQWETKAKQGLLRSDNALNEIVSDLRRALTDSVSGVGLTLDEIGISTSADYTKNGQLVIDETKLTQALKDSPDKVALLFTQESSYAYGDSDNASARYSQNGWINRINDIFQDNIRLTRDTNGNKGALVQLAGYELDNTESTSTLAKEIAKMDTTVSDMLADMLTKENKYYSRFAAMETTLQKLSAQATNLFGSSSSS